MCNTVCVSCDSCGNSMCHLKSSMYQPVDFDGLVSADYEGLSSEECKEILESTFPG